MLEPEMFTSSTPDNLWGEIKITRVEDELIKSHIFRRLKQINQLGAAEYVYPPATHKRYFHCIGTMELTNRLLNHLENKLKEKGYNVLKSEDFQNFRIAALLHDIGHGPFSHAIEHVLRRNPSFRPVIKSASGDIPACTHEQFSVDILKRNKEICDIFHKYNINLDSILGLIFGKYRGALKQFGNIISGDLDADRMDYVYRDIYNIGGTSKVLSKSIAIDDLIQTFDADFSKRRKSYVIFFPVEKKSKIDLFFLMRSIFLQRIPKNPEVRICDLMLARALEHALSTTPNPKEKVYKIFTEMKDNDLRSFLQSNDESKRLFEELEQRKFFKRYDFRFRELEAQDKYNLLRLSRDINNPISVELENAILKEIARESAKDGVNIDNQEIIIDFNLSQWYPTRFLIEDDYTKDLYYYYDLPTVRGISRAAFKDNLFSIYYKSENIEKYLTRMRERILKNTVTSIVLEFEKLSSMDLVLVLLYESDEIGKKHFGVKNKEWCGPYFKGMGKFHGLVRDLLESGLDFEYEFGVETYRNVFIDEDLNRDIFSLNSCDLIEIKISPVLVSSEEGKTYRHRYDLRICRYGRKYVDDFFGKYKSIMQRIHDITKKRFEKDVSKVNSIRELERKQEELERNVQIETDSGKLQKMYEELRKLRSNIKEKKNQTKIIIDYREDLY
jgi:HD superfamily phosphohydrolase